MTSDPHQDLLLLCRLYAGHSGLSHWRIAFLARGDGTFFDRLTKGGSCTVRTATKVVAWFSDHWPHDLAWPSDIPRPRPAQKAVA